MSGLLSKWKRSDKKTVISALDAVGDDADAHADALILQLELDIQKKLRNQRATHEHEQVIRSLQENNKEIAERLRRFEEDASPDQNDSLRVQLEKQKLENIRARKENGELMSRESDTLNQLKESMQQQTTQVNDLRRYAQIKSDLQTENALLQDKVEKNHKLTMLAAALGGASVLSTLAGWHVSSSAKDEVKRATIALLRLVHKAEMQNKTSVEESIEKLSRRAGKGQLRSKYVKKALEDLPLSKGTKVTMRKDRVFVTRTPDADTLAQLLERLSKKYLQRMRPWIGGAKVPSENA